MRIGLLSIVVALVLAWTPALARAERVASPASVTVCIQPLGPYDRKLTRVAAKGIGYLFGFKVVTKKRRALPRAAYYPPRKRYRADKLLDWLAAVVVPANRDCRIVLGFTRVDISTTKGRYKDWGIFGLGSLEEPVAVVSSHRLTRSRNRRKTGRRIVNVVNHELGHVLGLPHYDGPHKHCLMESAHGTINTVDTESGLLCPESIATIQRRHKVKLPARKRFDWRKVL